MTVGEGVKIDVQRLLRLFLEEAADHLITLETGLLRLEESPGDRTVIDNVFRAAHSLKGGSGTFGLPQVGRLTHAMESRLERVRTGAAPVTPELTSLLLRATDELRGLLAAAEEGGPVAHAAADVMAELEASLGMPVGVADRAAAAPAAVVAPAEPITYRIVFRPGAAIFAGGGDPMLILRDLAEAGELGPVQIDLSQLPPLAQMDPEQSYLGWTVELRSKQTPDQLREIFMFVEDGSQIEITAVAAPPSGVPGGAGAESAPKVEAAEAPGRGARAEASTLRVSTDKIDKLINLVGELVIAQSMITQVAREFTPAKLTRLQEAIGEMERNIRELQERVMTVRMVPLSTVFSRIPRLVRDLAGALDKKVNIQVTGGETEIDKSVIEQIGDPLTHLVRNAVDHGIETPAERLAAGKPEQGRVRLSAFHQGGNVEIHIEDDGRGLDTERIRAKAVALGIVGKDAALTSEELHALIFRPGFSTAAKVTDVSGRGVGMDVVKTNIEALNGSISLDSERGRGARFRISLPLTLAIIEGLCVGVDDEVYVVPLISIVESFRPSPGDVKTIANAGEVVLFRGKTLPLLRMRRLLDIPGRGQPPALPPLVVIIENHGAMVGLLVDNVQGQAQVVIKSLEANFRRIDGVMGATIMGDGRVALILDVQGLTRMVHRPRVVGSSTGSSERGADA